MCLVLADDIYPSFLLSGLELNYFLNLVDVFHTHLVFNYIYVIFYPNRNVFTFHTKICYSIKNYFHHSKHHPGQEVEDIYIFVNNFVQKNLNILSIMYMVQY